MKANIYDIIDLIKSLIENGKISGQEICKRFEQQVLELKNPILSYKFAQIPEADVQAHAAVIFNSGNEKYCDLMRKYLDEHVNSQQIDSFNTGIKLSKIRLLLDKELNSQK